MSYRKELIEVAAVALAAVQTLDLGNTALGKGSRTSSRQDNGGLGHLLNLLNEVKEERERQEEKWGAQTHKPDRWMVILGEEFGECNRAILENDLGGKP